MNIQQYNASLQPLKKLDINIYVLDYNFNIVDEISGVALSGSMSINADSDIRRTIDITLALSNANVKHSTEIDKFNSKLQYYLGDIVAFDDGVYQCVSVDSSGYIQGIFPFEDTYWSPYASTSSTTSMRYWQAGNPYWFNKYLKVEVGVEGEHTNEYVWNNMGIYLINSPSIAYDATTNTLSFQAVDLMSKLTGMRNGYLEGISHQILAGSSITGVIKSLLNEQGFYNMILEIPPMNDTPNDINIDIGQTTYDILTQLRDVNANWEMFFDENGVFRFQQIPSGNEIPMFGNEVWDKISTGCNISTNFEDVKNYIEVLGKQIEPNETATATLKNNIVTITLSRPFASYFSSDSAIDITWYIGFTIGDTTQQTIPLDAPISQITYKDSTGASMSIKMDGEALIYYNNETYFVRMVCSSKKVKSCEFGGYLQPKAIAFESNEESPFYVGDSHEHKSILNEVYVNFVSTDYQSYNESLVGAVDNNVITLNLSYTITTNSYTQAPIGTQWSFKVHAELENKVPINTLDVYYGGDAIQRFETSQNEPLVTSDNFDFYVQNGSITRISLDIYKDSSWGDSNKISLDYDGDYLITFVKTNNGLKAYAYYYPVSSKWWNNPTTQVYNLPRFDRMVRGVCSGDEYDNIYSNDLARQRANYELYLQCRLHDTVDITCSPLYWLDVNTVFSFDLNDSSNNNLWIVKSISTDLTVTGTQSISAMRYYPLYNW